MSIRRMINRLLEPAGLRLEKLPKDDGFPVLRALDRNGLEVLADPEFQASCRAIGPLSLLDTPRLANLWQLCRMTDPEGAMMEIGTYRGGGALHLAHAGRGRPLIVCDPFTQESFEHLDPALDRTFRTGQFADSTESAVRALLRPFNATVIRGYFPASVAESPLPRISFVHLDVDVYKATRESLLYLLTRADLCRQSLIVLDDVKRQAAGVDRAIAEVLEEVPGTLAFPLFPGQGLIVPGSWRGLRG